MNPPDALLCETFSRLAPLIETDRDLRGVRYAVSSDLHSAANIDSSSAVTTTSNWNDDSEVPSVMEWLERL